MNCCICLQNVERLYLQCRDKCKMISCKDCWEQVVDKSKCPICRRNFKYKYYYQPFIVGVIIILILFYSMSFPIEIIKKSDNNHIGNSEYDFICKDHPSICLKFNCHKNNINIENGECFDINFQLMNCRFFIFIHIVMILSTILYSFGYNLEMNYYKINYSQL